MSSSADYNRFEITVQPSRFKAIYEGKDTSITYTAPPLDKNLMTEVEKNPENMANRLSGIKRGDSIVIVYDPSQIDNPQYMGDAIGVSEIEKIVEDIIETPASLSRRRINVIFKKD